MLETIRAIKNSINKQLRKNTKKENDPHHFIEIIKNAKLTYLTEIKLKSIIDTCIEIEEKKIQGTFIEAGCALGGSSIIISASKSQSRSLNIYDVFGIIPAPSSNDTPDVHERYEIIKNGLSQGIDGDTYYGYIDNLKDVVRINLEKYGFKPEKHNIHLIEGLLQDSMTLIEPVAFAHIDVDWYDPVLTCLERISPRLSVGGSIIIDDYQDWGGCKKAVDDFLDHCDLKLSIDDTAQSRKITRIA